MLKRGRRLLKDDAGAALVEYALIVAGIAVVIIAAVLFLGGTLAAIFGESDAVIAAGGDVAAAEVDACPAIAGIQPAGSNCSDPNVPTDVCPYDPGVQSNTGQCTVVDLCPNDAGLQTTTPCPGSPVATYATWSQIGKSGKFCGQSAVQMHGGMGVTDELSVSHYFKRLTMIDLMFGNQQHHLTRYSNLAMAA